MKIQKITQKALREQEKNSGKERLRGDEREGLIMLLLAAQVVKDAEEKIGRRAGKIKRGAWRLHLAHSHIVRAGDDIMATVPVDQLQTAKHDMLSATYKIGWYRPLQVRDEWGVWIPYKDLSVMAGAISDHCITCGKDGNEMRKCKLRRILNDLPGKTDEPDDGGQCPWAVLM